jgi:hypothetical protein
MSGLAPGRQLRPNFSSGDHICADMMVAPVGTEKKTLKNKVILKHFIVLLHKICQHVKTRFNTLAVFAAISSVIFFF